MKKIVFFILFVIVSFAQDRQEIAQGLKEVANIENIDVKILYTIASIESNFNPYIISFLTNKDTKEYFRKSFKKSTYIFRAKKYKEDIYLVNISHKDKKQMIALSDFLYDLDMNIDFGLMQISKQNIKREDIQYIFDPKYNITISSKILKICHNKYKNLKDAIECYNKGFRVKKRYSYFAQWEKKYTNFWKQR